MPLLCDKTLYWHETPPDFERGDYLSAESTGPHGVLGKLVFQQGNSYEVTIRFNATFELLVIFLIADGREYPVGSFVPDAARLLVRDFILPATDQIDF